MLYWTSVFLVVALIAAVLGFTGMALAAAGVAKILFFIFLVLFLISPGASGFAAGMKGLILVGPGWTAGAPGEGRGARAEGKAEVRSSAGFLVPPRGLLHQRAIAFAGGFFQSFSVGDV
jgi:uncharacterized membrane protein YtjA (UPF0391 family)